MRCFHEAKMTWGILHGFLGENPEANNLYSWVSLLELRRLRH